MCWAPPSWPLAHVLTALQQHALRQLSHVQRAFFTRVQNEASSSSPRFYTARVYQFSPPQLAHPISHCYVCEPSLHDEEEDGTKAQRQAIHSAFFLPLDRPLIRTSNAVSLSASIWNRRVVTSVAPESSKKLRNVHLYAKPSGLVGSTQYLVDGEYVYHHYMQDKFNDKVQPILLLCVCVHASVPLLMWLPSLFSFPVVVSLLLGVGMRLPYLAEHMLLAAGPKVFQSIGECAFLR